MNHEESSRLTWWSIATVVLAIGVWWFVAISAIMSRDVDGGLFLSVVGGLERALPLYSRLFEIKDPLFFGAMFVAHAVAPAGPFVMDWFWIPVGALGGWLLARAVTTPDRALIVGLLVVPLILVGPFYAPGLTNTPGTAVTLLCMGLAINQRGILAGIAVGLLAFVKMLVLPLALIPVLVLLLFPSYRRVALRALIAGAATVATVAVTLQVLGLLVPYLEVLRWNSAYSFSIMEYFGYSPSPLGHLSKLVDQWGAAAWVAAALVVVVIIATIARWTCDSAWRTPERNVLTAWVLATAIGSLGVIGMSYIWDHHGQMFYLPAAVAAVALSAVLPESWPSIAALLVLLLSALLLGAWGTPSDIGTRVVTARDTFPAKWAEIDEMPKDARLLASVPLRDFSYARLGTNDDRGYLLSARRDATLACPQFHLYDFSPPEDFAWMLECVQDVDVILMTDNFVVFGNGGRAGSVQPILQYVDWAFDCLRVDDRQVCTRKPTA